MEGAAILGTDASQRSSAFISHLNSMRGNASVQKAERWAILRVFFGLKREAYMNTYANGLRDRIEPRIRTSKLLGCSARTLGKVVALRNKLFRENEPSQADICSFLLESNNRGNKKP